MKEGRVRKLAPTVYTTNVTEAPESIVRRLLWQLASLVFPDGERKSVEPIAAHARGEGAPASSWTKGGQDAQDERLTERVVGARLHVGVYSGTIQ